MRIALLLIIFSINNVLADYATDLMGAGLPAETANALANNFQYGVPANGTIKFKFGGVTRYQNKYDSSVPNYETYAATTDGADNQYLYMCGGGGPIEIDGDRGALLELAGNEVMPLSSRGRAMLFSGNVTQGAIGLNVTHPSGKILVQSISANVLEYVAATGATTVYNDTTITPASGTKNIILSAGMYSDNGAAKLEIPNGTTIPATCTVGEIFDDTNSNDCIDSGGGDGALCICKSTNTWALISNF